MSRRVLIVEDERDVRETLQDALVDEGYQVVTATNGRDALDQLPGLERPLVIILDLIMPVMNGVEFYEALQKERRFADIPVLVSTSDPSRAPSGVLIMRKPIDLDRLLSAVQTMFVTGPAGGSGTNNGEPDARPLRVAAALSDATSPGKRHPSRGAPGALGRITEVQQTVPASQPPGRGEPTPRPALR